MSGANTNQNSSLSLRRVLFIIYSSVVIVLSPSDDPWRTIYRIVLIAIPFTAWIIFEIRNMVINKIKIFSFEIVSVKKKIITYTILSVLSILAIYFIWIGPLITLYKYRILYIPKMQPSWISDYFGIPYDDVISKYGDETGQLFLNLIPGDKIIFEGNNGNIDMDVSYKFATNNPILEFCTHEREYCTNAEGIGEIINNANSYYSHIGNINVIDIYREIKGSMVLQKEIIR